MNEKPPPLVLGIETSCDETAASIVRGDGEILSNIVHSQVDMHQIYGGVVPEIAARSHMDQIETVVEQALKQADIDFPQLDAIAVTSGPGLIGGVIVGVMAAKVYASVFQKPLYGINHLEGHALTARLTNNVEFPFLLLLVSGGHCQILLAEGVGRYTRLGGTKDDALGEAFDKIAKMMELPYPGGPHIERLAKKGDPTRFTFPRPLIGQPGCDFSFSGLKTAVKLVLDAEWERHRSFSIEFQQDIAASFQSIAAAVLDDRLSNAFAMLSCRLHDGIRQELPDPVMRQGDAKGNGTVSSLVVAGGVAANMFLREKLTQIADRHNVRAVFPPIYLCTDNAAMIAWAGAERLQAGLAPEASIDPRARWPLSELTN